MSGAPGRLSCAVAVAREVGYNAAAGDDCLNAYAGASAQNRIFNPTPETVAIWEFNDFDVATPIPDGSVFADLSGNGLDAVVRGNSEFTTTAPLNFLGHLPTEAAKIHRRRAQQAAVSAPAAPSG